MDLESELLNVLDNPSSVWGAVANNLESGPRTLLLVLTTCTTPLSMIAWQEAVARLSTDAAVSFEASLRAIDDAFVTLHRGPDGDYTARFRNPSMDDFCADYLDKNVGVAVAVASANPTLFQVRRLLALGTARSSLGAWAHPNIHSALIAQPSVLYSRLLTLLPSDPLEQLRQPTPVELLLMLIGTAPRVEDPDLHRARSALSVFFESLEFGTHAQLLYRVLDDAVTARGIGKLLGSDFDTFYCNLWPSADALPHFDSLVNLETALHLDGRSAPWRDNFVGLTDDWLREDMDSDDLSLSRDYYAKVAEHLDLKELDETERWEELIEEAERQEPDPQEPEDDSWRSEGIGEPAPIPVSTQPRLDAVDALFEGLAASRRRP